MELIDESEIHFDPFDNDVGRNAYYTIEKSMGGTKEEVLMRLREGIKNDDLLSKEVGDSDGTCLHEIIRSLLQAADVRCPIVPDKSVVQVVTNVMFGLKSIM